MANEKKGKGLFGKIASAITGNESELSTEPKKTTGSKSYSDMLRERTAQRQESFKRFSPQEIDKIKSDKANGDQIVQK